MYILFISKTWRLINLKYYATFNFWKTQNLFESYNITSNSILTQYYQQKNEDFAMECCFFIWLHTSFYNVISLNLTPLKVGLYNEIFLSRPWNFYFKRKRSNISGSEMCVVKYCSVCSHNQVLFIRSW